MTEPVRRDWCEEHNRGDLSATDGLCPDCETRSAARRVDPLAGLSYRARKLFERVSNPRHWYQAYGARTPAAMHVKTCSPVERSSSARPTSSSGVRSSTPTCPCTPLNATCAR